MCESNIPIVDVDTDTVPNEIPNTKKSHDYLVDLVDISSNIFDYSNYDFSSSRDEKIIENILSIMPSYRGDMIQRHIAAVFTRDSKIDLLHFGFNHLTNSTNVRQSSIHAEESAIRSLLRSLGLSRNLKKMKYAKWCFLPETRCRKNYPKKDEYHYHPI